MSTLAERLALLFKEKPELSQAGLARACEIAQPSVNDWFSGRTKRMTGKNLLRAAVYLNVNPEWLATGKGEKYANESTNNIETGPDFKGNLPLISWVQAGEWMEAIDNFYPGDAEEWLACPVCSSKNSFVLRVRGQSMYNPSGITSFHEGDLIYVDPQRQPMNGSFVVVRLDDNKEATFKQLIVEGDKRYLKALNPAWPEQIIKIDGNATICGVVFFTGKRL